MSFIQENKINLNLNLKKSYTLVHFSDVHLINLNDNETDKQKDDAINHEKAWYRVRKDFANYFNEICNEEQMIPSCQCFDKLLDYTKKINPDALLMSGDIIDYNSTANLLYLSKSLKNFNIPFVLTYGNHETPNNIFDKIIDNSTFQIIKFGEFKVIGIDNSQKKITSECLNKLKEQLNDNCPIILCMHIPILTKYNEKEMQKYDSYFIIDYRNCDDITAEFIDILINNPLIKAIFCGHTHGASTSNFAIDKKQYCASSGLIGYVNLITIK